MKLELLDINKFVKQHDLGEVINTTLPSERDGYIKGSLFGEDIFGSFTSKDRQKTFGFISLKRKLIHPMVYTIIKSSSESIAKILNKKETYKFINNEFKIDPDGENGLMFLINSIENGLNFSKVGKKDKSTDIEFLKKNKKLILIDKYIVIPAGIRDINISKFSTVRISSEVNELYSSLFYLIKQTDSNEILERIQHSLMSITNWIKNDLRGKGGLIKGKMLKKSLDFSSRLVLLSSPDIDLGNIGLPWHTLLAIYKPFFINYIYKKDDIILKELQEYTNNTNLDINDANKLLTEIHKNPNMYPDKLKDTIIIGLKEIIKGQIVVCKRDPAMDRASWFSAEPIITSGTTAIVNSMDLEPIGGDSDKQYCPFI